MTSPQRRTNVPSRKAVATARRVEDALIRAWGRDRVEASTDTDSTTFARVPHDGEPLVRVVVNRRGDVTVLLDGFECDEDWERVVATLEAPEVVTVHRGQNWVHCFVLDGPGGSAAFYVIGSEASGDSSTRRWLRALPGWE